MKAFGLFDQEYVRRLPNGYRMILVPSDFLQGEIFWHGEYDGRTIAWLSRALAPDSTFVDVGSHVGYFLLTAAGVARKGRLVGFEPQKALLDQCRRTLDLNGIRNVELFNLALSDTNGTAEFHLSHVSNTGMSGLRRPPGEPGEVIPVETATFDSLGLAIPSDKPVFVKIDVEGAELRVLKGMSAFIREMKPVILIELIPELLAAYDTKVSDIHAWLSDMGYHAFRIRADGTLEQVEGYPGSDNMIFKVD